MTIVFDEAYGAYITTLIEESLERSIDAVEMQLLDYDPFMSMVDRERESNFLIGRRDDLYTRLNELRADSGRAPLDPSRCINRQEPED